MNEESKESQIETILEFLENIPGMFSTRKRKNVPDPKTKEGKEAIRKHIENSMSKETEPTLPQTIPDPAVFQILVGHYEVDSAKQEQIEREHQMAMAAEDVVGDLLEEYIISEASEYNWVRCYGETLKGTDFIKKDEDGWRLLQIKNRDNSENSSSKKIRKSLKKDYGVDIELWFRTFHKTGKTNWENFPDEDLKSILSEESFGEYIDSWLEQIKTQEE